MVIKKTTLTMAISIAFHTRYRSRVRLTIPLSDMQKAGLIEGERYGVKVMKPGKIMIRPDPESRREVPKRLQKTEEVTLNLFGINLGFPAFASEPIERETIVVPGGGIIVQVPAVDELTERENVIRPAEFRGDWRDAVGRKTGAAAAIALDMYRYGGSNRPVNLEHLLDLLRNAGHRVERVNERLFRIDGKSACLSDLVERTQEIDEGWELVADAA